MQRLRAFSLIELSMVVFIAGFIAAAVITLNKKSTDRECYEKTQQQLQRVRATIERYATSNDRFPLPARRNVSGNGREIDTTAIGDLDTITNADGSKAVYGAIPYITIGLARDDSIDCWGNKLTYATTLDLANSTKFIDPATHGALTINTSPGTVFLRNAGYAVISHGADGLGALKENYQALNSNLGNHGWCNPGTATSTADWSRRTNCALTNSTLASAPFNDGKDAGTNFFDDIIIYRGKPWKPAPPCPAGYQNWGSGGIQCSALVPQVAEGASLTNIPSTSSSPGAIDVTCTNGAIHVDNWWCHADCLAGADATWGSSNDCNAALTSTLAYGATTTLVADGTRGIKGTGQVQVQCNGGYISALPSTGTCYPTCRTGYIFWGPGNACQGGWGISDQPLFFNQTRIITQSGVPGGSITVQCVGRNSITATNTGTCN